MKTLVDIREKESVIENIRDLFPETEFPSPILEPIFFGRLKPKKVINRNLIVDSDTGNQFDIVSDAYHLVQHEEIIDMVMNACPEEYGTPKFKIKFINNKARSFFSVTFPEIGDFKVDGSKIEPKIMIGNSYDRTARVSYSWGANELICSNGLRGFVEKGNKKVKHLNGIFSKMDMQGIIKGTLSKFSEQKLIWDQWSKKKLKQKDMEYIIESLPFTKNEKERLVELPLLNKGGESLKTLKNKVTIWNINSAATQFAKHEVKSEIRSITLENDISKSIVHTVTKNNLI